MKLISKTQSNWILKSRWLAVAVLGLISLFLASSARAETPPGLSGMPGMTGSPGTTGSPSGGAMPMPAPPGGGGCASGYCGSGSNPNANSTGNGSCGSTCQANVAGANGNSSAAASGGSADGASPPTIPPGCPGGPSSTDLTDCIQNLASHLPGVGGYIGAVGTIKTCMDAFACTAEDAGDQANSIAQCIASATGAGGIPVALMELITSCGPGVGTMIIRACGQAVSGPLLGDPPATPPPGGCAPGNPGGRARIAYCTIQEGKQSAPPDCDNLPACDPG